MKVKVDGESSMMASTARTGRWHLGLMKQLVLAHDQVGWLSIIHVATQAPHLENRSPNIQFRCLFDVAFATGLAFVDSAPDQGREATANRVRSASKQLIGPLESKVGRNEPCPCGLGQEMLPRVTLHCVS
jgi:hypothetical protein